MTTLFLVTPCMCDDFFVKNVKESAGCKSPGERKALTSLGARSLKTFTFTILVYNYKADLTISFIIWESNQQEQLSATIPHMVMDALMISKFIGDFLSNCLLDILEWGQVRWQINSLHILSVSSHRRD